MVVVDDYTKYFVASGFFHNLVMHSNGWQCICQVLSPLSCSYKHPFGFTRVERHVILFSPFDQFMNTIE